MRKAAAGAGQKIEKAAIVRGQKIPTVPESDSYYIRAKVRGKPMTVVTLQITHEIMTKLESERRMISRREGKKCSRLRFINDFLHRALAASGEITRRPLKRAG